MKQAWLLFLPVFTEGAVAFRPLKSKRKDDGLQPRAFCFPMEQSPRLKAISTYAEDSVA
jgi:hypothetical protein